MPTYEFIECIEAITGLNHVEWIMGHLFTCECRDWEECPQGGNFNVPSPS
jgi:hypothetical protein